MSGSAAKRCVKTFNKIIITGLCLSLVLVLGGTVTTYAAEKGKAFADDRFPKGVNPHDQIDDVGEIMWDRCLWCHGEKPDIEVAMSVDDVTFSKKFKNLTDMCMKCHPERMHPGGSLMASVDDRYNAAPNHLVKPSDYILDLMDEKLDKSNTILPLDPKDGRITCATCHNPHERGLLRGKADVGADGFLLIRTTRGAPSCLFCHEM